MEAAGEGAVPVPEVHGGAVLARVRASGRAQPEREVAAPEAPLFQLHAGLQGRPPAAQAPGRQPQHRVGAARGWGRAGRGRERDADVKGKEVSREMQSRHTLRIRKPAQRADLLTINAPGVRPRTGPAPFPAGNLRAASMMRKGLGCMVAGEAGHWLQRD